MTPDHIQLTKALSALKEAYPSALVPSYLVLWRAVVAGRIPAERFRAGWFVKRSDLPAIAVALEMIRPSEAERDRKAAARSRRRQGIPAPAAQVA